MFERMFVYDKDDDKGGKGDSDDKNKHKHKSSDEPVTFETWHEGLDATQQGLIAGHVTGLKTALGSERDARSKAEEGLRAVAGKLEKGSEAQKEVLRLADENATGTVKTDFYEEAHAAGVTNLKLAYAFVTMEKLFDKRGNVDFEALKKANPELFSRSKNPPGGAGDGTDTHKLQDGKGMNDFIRGAAGR